jgi:PBP1b-binding outer membrane lipoprotein LpoB
MLTRENESVIKRIILIAAVGLLVSGCYMVPLAFIGPATSGFTSSSIMQAAVTSTANHMIKKTTGKTFSEHAMDTIDMDKVSLGYFPSNKSNNLILPLAKPL